MYTRVSALAAAGKILGMDAGLFIVALIVGVVCALVAQRVMMPKGYGERASFCLGFFLGLIGLVIAFVLPPKNGSEAARNNTSEADKASALREYKKLLDEGAITQQEYDQKKGELLS